MTTRICLSGASGAMGQAIQRLCQAGSRWSVVATCGQSDSEQVAADVLIDFSVPEQTERAVRLARERGMALVVGTTGLDSDIQSLIEQAAASLPVCQAANFSPGVAVIERLVVEAARLLGDDFDAEITETHHRRKRDAPSGTALALARTLLSARDNRGRLVTGGAREGADCGRKPGDIGVQSVRGGDVIGEHAVRFLGEGEQLEIIHRAGSRDIFARGALLAAGALVGREPGLYRLEELL